MSLESALEEYPKERSLKDGSRCTVRPLDPTDASRLHRFFCGLPSQELIFLKHRVIEPRVTNSWCEEIDLGRNLPLLAVHNGDIAGICTLHQQLGGWKRHIGRLSVLVHPQLRGRGIGVMLVQEVILIARQCGLEKVEAEFIGEQANALKMFGFLGFSTLVRLADYVKDMEAVSHDYILMGLDLGVDEEYAGVG